MFRDKTPLTNLGYGMTSRDAPMAQDEEKKANPNSGFIARALEDKPVVKFVSTMAATLAASYATSKMLGKGGLKLAKTLQRSADSGSKLGRRFVESAAQIRRTLDELEGINRYVDDGVDPYARLVYEKPDGSIVKPTLTRLVGPEYVSDGTRWMTRNEFKAIAAGRQPVAEWAYKDELQTNLIRHTRSLGLMLPSTYITQRGLTDPLFGNSEDKPKVKWYNPVDVVTDFVKQSTLNIGLFVLPQGAAGATSQRLKQLASAPYQDFPLALSKNQLKTANKVADIKTILTSFGQDAEFLLNQANRISSSAAYAFNTSFQEAQRKESGIIFAMDQAKRGAKAARAAAELSGEGKLQAAAKVARSYLFGYSNKTNAKLILKPDKFGNSNLFDIDETTRGFVDTIPALRGITTGARQFQKDFKNARNAYDVISGAISFDQALKRTSGNVTNAADILSSTIQNIKRQHTSRFYNLVKDSLDSRTMVDPDGDVVRGGIGDFARTYESNAYAKAVQQAMIRRGVDKETAADFISQVKVNRLLGVFDRDRNISERVTYGIKKINVTNDDEFFAQMVARARKDLGSKAESFTAEQLKASFGEADAAFTNQAYRQLLRERGEIAYKQFEKDVVIKHANAIARPQKARYEDFRGPLSGQKMEFLSRKVAQNLGVKLVESDGAYTPSSFIARELAKRGINASDASQLKGYLVSNKLMTPASSPSGFNIFGLRQLSIDEAFDKGIFDAFSDETRKEARRVFSSVAVQDPVSKTIGYSGLTGVFQTASGRIVDTTRMRSGFSNLVDSLTEGYGIPIVKFNPLQLMGFGGPRGVNKFKEIQLVPGYSRQDFLSGTMDQPDVYAWVNQRTGLFGGVGKLFGIKSGDLGTAKVSESAGLYKRFSSIETDLYSSAARLASGREQPRTSAISDEHANFIERFKSSFDIAEEQPSSLLRKFGRFTRRKSDIKNPTVFSRLMAEGTIRTDRRGGTLSFSSAGDDLQIVDQTGKVAYSAKETREAFDSFRQETSRRGTPLRVMRAFEEDLGLRRLNIRGKVQRLSDISDTDLPEAFSSLENIIGSTISRLRASGKETASLTRGLNYVKNLMDESDQLARDVVKHRSPTINTRQDQIRNAINKLLIETKAYDDYAGDPGQIAARMEQVLQSLRRTGQISTEQMSEARAAALENIFDLISYQTYRPAAQFGMNQSSALNRIITLKNNDEIFSGALQGLLKPFTTQTIANVGAGGTGRFTSVVRPMFKRQFGVSPYELADDAVNPLGNAGTTFVPTFGTLLDRAASGQQSFSSILGNVLGANSYSSPNTFSAASIPAIHLSSRLNRYFGTVGLGIDADKYSSPLSFFAGGIVGKRVLPIYAGGVAALSIDRTIGGYAQEKDLRGERVYSPFFLGKAARGVVEAQAITAGIIPGGMGYEEKREQLLEGEVAVRQGRFWPLGNTPFMGGKVQYYRPSYYRRLQSGSVYTSDAFGSPLERLAYGYDFSPLRPLDPYRFEREHYFDRPYPVTGEYFSGPFGPITPLLNMTVGRLLKPQVPMHQAEVANALANYVPAGESGSYDPTGLMSSGRVRPVRAGIFSNNDRQPNQFSSSVVGLQIGGYNTGLGGDAGQLNTARNITFNTIAANNQGYQQSRLYGPPPVPGFIPPSIVPSGLPTSTPSLSFQSSELGYRMQEMAGIYGFGFSSLRETFGFGSGDFEPNRAVLQSSAKAYGATRSFWDLNLGGLGDVPAADSSLELSEITRRFIPKERTNVSYLNPIRNTMGMRYPFLPGSDYFINFQTGDPFTKVQEGELRLPGVAYERLNPTRRDYASPVTQLDILGDVAPYSRQFRQLNRTLNLGNLQPSERAEVAEIRAQVEETTRRNTFQPYKFKYSSAEELGMSRSSKKLAEFGEYLAHRDTFINTKFFPNRTAQEDWERRNIYGNSFPEWQSPIESFIKPIYYKASQRNPITAGLITAGIGSMFGRGPKERALGAVFGLATGTAFSAYTNTREMLTGERFIPKERKKQMALEEYTDILSYVKNRSLATQAAQSGDMAAANQFNQAARRTMYGADLYGSSIDTLSLAVPKRKREHFREMINAPVEEREAILSTAPRLERRIYQAAWGMPVEEKPDLTEYFTRHELPDLSWEGWHPNTNIDHVKIKVGQSMGINMSQMGYYPQQIREANLTNPSYPSFMASESQAAVAARLRMMMSRNGINGSVTPVPNYNGGPSVNISAGIF